MRSAHSWKRRTDKQTWMSEATHGLETIVRVEFEAKGGGTEVRLTHSGLPDDEAENHRKGWEDILAALEDLR
jgi:activator of Hsp90 ATPase-like protein